MNTRFAIALNALLTLAVVTAPSPALAEDLPPTERTTGTVLPVTEAMIDAARSFRRVDINRDGIVDADEYASQRVVTAQLARFSRSVSIEGQHVMTMALPEDVPGRLGDSEKAALDTVARRDFKVRAFGSKGLDAAGWQDARLELFSNADANGDDVLEGAELENYLRALAGQLTASLPIS